MDPQESEDIVMLSAEYLIRWPRKTIWYNKHQTSAFLRRFAKCRALDRRKKMQTETGYVKDQEENWEITHAQKTLEDEVLLHFGRRAVKKAVKSLPYVYNVSIRFELVDELTSAEIAEIMGVSPAAVRKRQQRAREMIYDYLVRKYGDKGARHERKQRAVSS